MTSLEVEESVDKVGSKPKWKPERPTKWFSCEGCLAAAWVTHDEGPMGSETRIRIQYSRKYKQHGKTKFKKSFDPSDTPNLIAVAQKMSVWAMEVLAKAEDA